MMKKIIILVILVVTPSLFGFSEDKMIPVVIDGDEINYFQQEGKVVAKGNVKIEYKETELYCDEIAYDANENIAHVVGNVRIIRDGSQLKGQDVVYNFNTQDAQISEVKLSDKPIYGSAETAEKKGQEQYILNKGYVTTCDLDVPHYRLVAKRVVVYPGEKVVAKNMVLKVGKVPILYIPYFSQSLKDTSFPLELSPGKNSEWGYYMLSRWRYSFSGKNRGKAILDWYEGRGTGLGVTHTLESKKYGKSLLRYYIIQDELYKIENREELFDEYPDRKNIPDKRLEDDRYKIEFAYNWEPNPNLYIMGEFNKYSDQYLRKDFFEREYDIEPHPLSYALANYAFSSSSLSLLTQKRFNRFFTETEYLPQIEYNFYNQRLGETQFYLQSSDSFGNLSYRAANSGTEHDSLRAYSHNTLSYVDSIRWLRINPYVSTHSSFYSRNRFGEDEIFRFAPEMGVTFSTKLYKIFKAGWNFFGEKIEEARHILNPIIEYSYIHDPTVSNNNIYQFDSKDRLSREEKVVFTLENKIQARNAERTWDFIYFSPSLEYQINRDVGGSGFDNLKAEFEFYPKENLSVNAESEFDLDTERFDEFNADFTIKDDAEMEVWGEKVTKEKYSLSLGHRYTRQDSSQGTLDFTYQLTPRLQFKNYMRYEYNTEDFEYQQYAIRADLHCWWLDIGLNIDRHERGGKDFTVWFVFTLKAFPDINLGFDQTYSGAKSSY